MLERVLRQMKEVDELAQAIVHWRTFPERAAQMASMPEDLDPAVRQALLGRGISELYSHQRLAIDAIRGGRNTVVVTPTASGKSLCYLVPVLERLRQQPGRRALMLFPTKALAQDQVKELDRLIDAMGGGIRSFTYDGDTPPSTRAALREAGDIVVTNPHMLHSGIMPGHVKWVSLFENLDYVIIDELHTYRGVFGSHVANVLRRLDRICRHYGSRPVHVATSATIENPREHAEALVGAPFELVDRDQDGSPQGRRHFLFYNPPVVHEGIGLRAPAIEEVRRMAPLFLRAGVQAIYFLRSRAQVEVLTKYLRDIAEREGIQESRVAGYRGGYLPLERRRIEKGLKDGTVLAVAATNALELGIDIGSLEAAVLVGYPGSVASLWQQAGRAGRRHGESVVVLCGRSDPLDQYLMRNPDFLFDRPHEAVRIDADNLVIRLAHLECSLFELPMSEGEVFGGDGDTPDLLDYLTREAGVLTRSDTPQGRRWHWMSEAHPARDTSLLAADADNFVIYDLDARRVFAEIDRPAALTEIHPGAIYGHQGQQYYIESLDYVDRRALARPVQSDYYTQAETDFTLDVLFADDRVEHLLPSGAPSYEAGIGQVHVTISPTIYKKIKYYTRENVGAGEIELPPEEMETDAFWLALDEEMATEAGLRDGSNSRGLLALGRALAEMLPLYLLCDISDLRVHTEIRSPHFDLPVIYIVEASPGGVGLARRAFQRHREVLAAAVEAMSGCACEEGCPACTGLVASPGRPSPGKRTALALAGRMLAARVEAGVAS